MIVGAAGAVVSICNVPAGLITAPERSALLFAPSRRVAPFRLNDVTVRSLMSCPVFRRSGGLGLEPSPVEMYRKPSRPK